MNPIETAPLWQVAIVTDGESAAIAQKAECDYGGHYWAIDPDGCLEWEPTLWTPWPPVATQPTGNPYIDLDVGSITVPIGFVRKMVDALATTQATFADYAELHSRKLDGALNPSDHRAITAKVKRNQDMADMCDEALALGQSVITAYDQEAERG